MVKVRGDPFLLREQKEPAEEGERTRAPQNPPRRPKRSFLDPDFLDIVN